MLARNPQEATEEQPSSSTNTDPWSKQRRQMSLTAGRTFRAVYTLQLVDALLLKLSIDGTHRIML